MRWIVAGIGAVLLLVTFYGTNVSPTLWEIMASSGHPHQSSEIPLKVTISPPHGTSASTGSTSVVLGVTLENTSDEPLSLLRWSSPLDPRASAIGVFRFTSKSSGEKIPCVDLKINRKIPGSGVFSAVDENIITIKAGEKVQRDVEVKKHEVHFEEGGSYLVKAKGRWMGVWLGEGRELSMKEVKIGEFESAEFEVEV